MSLEQGLTYDAAQILDMGTVHNPTQEKGSGEWFQHVKPKNSGVLPSVEPNTMMLRTGAWSIADLCKNVQIQTRRLMNFKEQPHGRWKRGSTIPGDWRLRFIEEEQLSSYRLDRPRAQIMLTCMAATALLVHRLVTDEDLFAGSTIEGLEPSNGGNTSIAWQARRLIIFARTPYHLKRLLCIGDKID